MNPFVYLFLIILVLGVVQILFAIFALDSLVNAHDLPTSKRARKRIYELINKYKPEAKSFYDLGCSRGGLVINVKKKFPQTCVYGIDKNRIRLFFAKARALLAGKRVNFRQADIFQYDFSDADVIYTYLWYDLMPPLEDKLQKELKPGAVVITNTSHFVHWEPVETHITYPPKPKFEKLFVYIKE